MRKLIDLKDLLKHSILDLYSAEEQIIQAFPTMIEKATAIELKKVLTNHLDIIKQHTARHDIIKQVMLGKEAYQIMRK